MTTENQTRPSPELSRADFMTYAGQALDWIGRYLENMEAYPVLAPTKPGAIKQQLPDAPPVTAEPLEQILADFEKIIVPGMTHWNHPRFFAYFSITGSAPGIIGEMLASALNVNAMLWKTSPAATELEVVVLDWLRQLLGLPPAFEGVINDTASVSSLCAMAAAREAAGLKIRELGLAGRTDLPPLAFYTSTEAHSSIEKAAIVLGIGQNGLRKIPTDSHFQMDVQALARAIETDLAQGIKPLGVIATIGTTSTTSVDPIQPIADLCAQYGLWLHVDAAYGGAAALLPEQQAHFVGWERADSIVMNPHKWLFTPIDCSVLFCRRPEVLRQAFSLTPEYLRTTEADQVKNLMDYGVALGRRFRALKLWFVIRTLGQAGLQQAIRNHIDFAQRLKARFAADPNFEMLAPTPFSTLVFRLAPPQLKNASDEDLNALNNKLLDQINQTGKVFLSHTKLRGKFALRLAIGNLKTTWADCELAWEIIQQTARLLIAAAKS